MDYSLLSLAGLIALAVIISTKLHSRSWPGRPGWQYQRVFSVGFMGLLFLVSGLVGWDLSHSHGWFQGAKWVEGPVWWQVGLGAGLVMLAIFWARRVPPRLVRRSQVIAAVLLVGLSATPRAAQAPALPPSCGPIGDLRFVCGPPGPEDLVAVPRTPWLVSSAMADDGGIYVVDTAKGTSLKVFPTATSADRLDATAYASCPGPLQGKDRTSFTTHGLYLKTGGRSTHTLYAVHHGGRESIEVFTLDAGATPPSVTWIGCVVAPDPIGLNAVVALPDGGFAATNFDPRPPAGAPAAAGVSAKVLSGDRNGEVWEWHPKTGWTKVPGSEASGANGLEISADGKWYYVAQWGNRAFMRLSRGRTLVERKEIPVGFRVDNLRWSRDGRTLLVAGQDRALAELPQGAGPVTQVSIIGRIDPQAMTYQELVRKPLAPGLFASTVALEVGREYWTGSFRGDRITRYPIPAGK